MVNKTQVRTFSNTRGEGKFFNFDVLDSSGCDVRIVGFNEAVDRFYEVVQKGQIVKISKATAKPKRNVRVALPWTPFTTTQQPQYNRTMCEAELTLENSSEIVPCPDDTEAIPSAVYNVCACSTL